MNSSPLPPQNALIGCRQFLGGKRLPGETVRCSRRQGTRRPRPMTLLEMRRTLAPQQSPIAASRCVAANCKFANFCRQKTPEGRHAAFRLPVQPRACFPAESVEAGREILPLASCLVSPRRLVTGTEGNTGELPSAMMTTAADSDAPLQAVSAYPLHATMDHSTYGTSCTA